MVVEYQGGSILLLEYCTTYLGVQTFPLRYFILGLILLTPGPESVPRVF